MTSYIPSIWRASFRTHEIISILPTGWLETNFFERYFDGEPAAYDEFIGVHDGIVGEESIAPEMYAHMSGLSRAAVEDMWATAKIAEASRNGRVTTK